MDFPTVFLNHLLLSIVPWVAGGLIGGSLGYLLALAIRPLQARAGLYRVLRLVPWRTISFVLAAIAVNPIYPIILLFHLGPSLGSVFPYSVFLIYALASLSFLIFALALPFTTSIVTSYWFPPSLRERLVAGARTLGVASVVLAFTASYFGVNGAGSLMAKSKGAFDYEGVWLGFVIIVSMALIVDLVMGVLQMVIARPAEAGAEG